MRRLFQHLQFVNDVARGRLKANRNFNAFPDDIFIVSYPRSGNTWMRFLIGNLMHPETPVNFVNVINCIPSIHDTSDRELRSFPRPRILKSHDIFDARYKTAIYIVRDPRDVAVSTYHFLRKWRNIPDGYSMDEFVSLFLGGECEEWGMVANWGEHVLSWLGTRQGHAGFLLLRYEDILKRPTRELAKVGALLNINPTPERLARAVELSSSDRMRKLEKAEGEKSMMTKTTRQDIPFVRKATSGGWKAVLPKKSVAEIENAWGPIMLHLGYQLTAEGPQRAMELDWDLCGAPLPVLAVS